MKEKTARAKPKFKVGRIENGTLQGGEVFDASLAEQYVKSIPLYIASKAAGNRLLKGVSRFEIESVGMFAMLPEMELNQGKHEFYLDGNGRTQSDAFLSLYLRNPDEVLAVVALSRAIYRKLLSNEEEEAAAFRAYFVGTADHPTMSKGTAGTSRRRSRAKMAVSEKVNRFLKAASVRSKAGQ
jgi:hypothetical protein